MKKFFVLIFVLTFSCEKDNIKLENYNEVFTIEEFNELEMLLSDFDFLVTKSTKEDNIEEAYLKFNAQIVFNNGTNYHQEFQNIDSKIEKLKVFNSIWVLMYQKETKETYLEFKGNSKYLNYLNELSSKNKWYLDYYNILNDIGDVPPSFVGGLLMNKNKKDFKNDNIRLLYVINYITTFN
ncbi:hypothetical protein [Aurantibacter sp.]|uniref:hypothetical protein n=1 Tax=Aurantibacter sp. TaxID=2807103 RepID=UPI0035C861DC